MSVKKSLSFAGKEAPKTNSSLSNDEMNSLTTRECKLISPEEASEIALLKLSVEDLFHKTASALKVVIVYPNARAETFTTFDDKAKAMIANLCRINWKAVVKLPFQHLNVREELGDPLQRVVGREFEEYSGNATVLF